MRYKFVKIVKKARQGSRLAKKLRNQFFLIILASIVLIFGSAYIIWISESESKDSYSEAVWTILFTLIGQGEFASNPKTVIGRVIVFLVSVLGIAVLGVIFSEILQRIINSKFREMLGMSRCKYKDHTIICGWSERDRIILKELTGNGKEVAVIANERPQNISSDRVFFVSGSPHDQNVLTRAGITDAQAVVILSEHAGSVSESEADSRTILIALAIESMNSNIYSIIELVNPDNERYARLANVNDIIYGDKVVAEITAMCAAHRGISVFIRDILCATDDGYNLSAFNVSDEFSGKTVKELFERVKSEGHLPVGLLTPPQNNSTANSNQWESQINPDEDIVINLPMKCVCIVKNNLEVKRRFRHLIKFKKNSPPEEGWQRS